MSITLSRFVPRMISRRFQTRQEPLSRSEAERFQGVMLFADVSGSTSLADLLSQHGPDGAETMMELLNACFASVVDHIEACGGDIIKFAGDGLLAVWHEEERAKRTAIVRAAHCALAFQQALSRQAELRGVTLAMRVCVTAGEMFIAHLGGIHDRWELLVAGNPVEQLKACLPRCTPDIVTLSREAFLPIAHLSVAEPVGKDGVDAEFFHLRSLLGTPPIMPSLEPNAAGQNNAIRAYMPRALVAQLNHTQLIWMVELRRVTVLFALLEGLESFAPYEVDRAQEVMQAAQRCVYREEGTILRLSVDEKGVMLMIAFGLSPLAHEDDPVRGVKTALALQRELERLDQPCRVGVSTGKVVCGSVGSERRCEYALVGYSINLAARLASNADTVLCDEETVHSTVGQVVYEPLAAISIKGKQSKVNVFVPIGLGGISQLRRASAHTDALVEGAVMAWLDRLPTSHQLLLKVASVLAEPFDTVVLTQLYPIAELRPEVPRYLAALERRGLLTREGSQLPQHFSFAHRHARTVFSSLLSAAQRRSLQGALNAPPGSESPLLSAPGNTLMLEEARLTG